MHLTASHLERYGFAVVAVGAALLYKLLLAPVADAQTPYLLFSLAVLATAWRGGWGPGLLATALSVVSADYFFLEPRYVLGPAESGQAVSLGMFALELLAVTVIAARGHRALRTASDPQRARAAADMQARVEKLQRLVDTSPAAVVGMDETGAVTFWSARAAKLFGWTEDDVLGRDLAGLVLPAAERDAWRAERERFLKAGDGAPVGRRAMRVLRRDRSDVRVDVVTEARRLSGRWEFVLFLLDVTDKARAEEALRREAAFAACLATSIAPGVVAVDGEGRVRYANPAAEQLLGVAADDARGQLFDDLVHGADRHGAEGADCALTRRLRSGEELAEEEDAFRRRSGEALPVRWVASPMQGPVPGAVVVFEDDRRRRESERERLEELAREQEARRNAEADVRMRDEFMATLSHELRTPLSAIVGWAHLLRTGNLEAADRDRAVETIDRSAKSQAQLISDILDVSGIITGKVRLDPEPVPLFSVVQAAVDTVRPAAERKGVRLETQVAGEAASARVSGDANRLQQIVWNLLSNGVKFTPAGGTVHVHLAVHGDQAEIVVRDEGRGITPEFLPHVFERFRQAEAVAGERGSGGLGLGLAIVRHLVELHKGTVQASSAGDGQGATFTVRLPLLRPGELPEHRGRGEGRAAAEPSLEGVRVLVVDDDADVRGMMETVLTERGAQVTSAASAGEALDSVAREPPDVLLSDLAMPVMDGYALLRELRGRPEATRIPAAAVTAYARAEDRRQALLAGFQMHVAKPIEPDELVAVVASLAGKT